ncbi:MAG: SMC-Scp complex subunit ScpB [Candidatus Doudnabacteria bacterium RIFCSPHIGHO2_02_FULL_48_21]|uniref:SMC-Scp complex subunit ScpB n=1 Tax=Candidatus Doudnabacteria bacterium RIFCSPLOWO2_02_FULL_48_13 TaxID=1817845 RepID=A0A1F5Q8G3_9BACT|nr:MAG: SMC-Scp complex subunit ScpB [Candidatus Doudnabacteria bacterium RIFCSPHIGHO2_01_48_18]OGE78006.1 MAG: SMC-Scp complex subunit ScpB [Candidatus Doudnabacteria bacterium RIFCSPHIGHO2_01_FULL_48_180]OGE91043.1 MAG: SMC-Scp complex subunit ScpB [Candidatus Doudnabacteria bacterium RIFCSPHIGHO2_12_FULL_47_25]OGE93407.1 MAG: SMC-Scp complex subunit ScpB [Candidatus Doudnabacteria bacterium RIFCSPHIGHO2_02_FULL_48_21]OGE97419.1 MAG: SMC-Scp complex subunit ScpB [Candidatus Doudnabacteria bac
MLSMMDLKSQIESLLFVAGRPVSLKELHKATGRPEDDIVKVLEELKKAREDSGIIILEQDKKFLMSSNPEHTTAVKEFLNTDLRQKLTDAAIETLAIITYKQPVSRAEIEAIRGVNSQYTIRLLMMRGLIEKAAGKDARSNYYQTTHEFLQHLGITSIKDLPEFADLTSKVAPPEAFKQAA